MNIPVIWHPSVWGWISDVLFVILIVLQTLFSRIGFMKSKSFFRHGTVITFMRDIAKSLNSGRCTLSGSLIRILSMLVCAFAALVLAACASSGGSRVSQAKSHKVPPLTLEEGDVIKMFFPGAVEYSGSQKIRTDGNITLPLLGEIRVAGKTISQVQKDLSDKYKNQLQNSEVVVSIEASGKPVIISGGVVSPGKFTFDRPTTLLEAIMGAGGFKDFAKANKVSVIRLVNGVYRTDVFDMSQGLNGGEVPVVYINNGDMVHIPLSSW